MDRHVRWLRHHILTSVAKQTATTFCVVAVLTFASMFVTGQGLALAGTTALALGQFIAFLRIVLSLRRNPLSYRFVQRFIDEPFAYRARPAAPAEDVHKSAQSLAGFVPSATICGPDIDSEPLFDVLHDPTGVIVASISRASGAITLISELNDQRLLVTDGRALPPHERIISNRAPDASSGAVISAHRAALIQRHQPRPCGSAAQVVLESLQIERDVYTALGPALAPFFDMEAKKRSWFRMVAPLKATELAGIDWLATPTAAQPASAPTEPGATPTVDPARDETAAKGVTPHATVAEARSQISLASALAAAEVKAQEPTVLPPTPALRQQPVALPIQPPSPTSGPAPEDCVTILVPSTTPVPAIQEVRPPTAIPIALPTPAVAPPLMVKLGEVSTEPVAVAPPAHMHPSTQFSPVVQESIFCAEGSAAVTAAGVPEPRAAEGASLADFIRDAPDSPAALGTFHRRTELERQ